MFALPQRERTWCRPAGRRERQTDGRTCRAPLQPAAAATNPARPGLVRCSFPLHRAGQAGTPVDLLPFFLRVVHQLCRPLDRYTATAARGGRCRARSSLWTTAAMSAMRRDLSCIFAVGPCSIRQGNPNYQDVQTREKNTVDKKKTLQSVLEIVCHERRVEMNNSIFFMKLNTPILSWYGIHDRSINLAIRLICYVVAKECN